VRMDDRVTVRRSQHERRSRTQELVLNAAIDLLYERGYANFTTADVAERAGVSRGAQNHYFRTKGDLVLSACRHAMAIAIKAARSMAVDARQSSDVVNYFIDQSRRFFLTPSYIATIDLLVAARTDLALSREYRHLINRTREELDAIWSSVFQEMGIPKEQAFILMSLTHNLMRGMAISRLWGTSAATNDELIECWRRFVLDTAKPRKRFEERRAGKSRAKSKTAVRQVKGSSRRRRTSAAKHR
jgi:AcrR family transcriptional regulator